MQQDFTQTYPPIKIVAPNPFWSVESLGYNQVAWARIGRIQNG